MQYKSQWIKEEISENKSWKNFRRYCRWNLQGNSLGNFKRNSWANLWRTSWRKKLQFLVELETPGGIEHWTSVNSQEELMEKSQESATFSDIQINYQVLIKRNRTKLPREILEYSWWNLRKTSRWNLKIVSEKWQKIRYIENIIRSFKGTPEVSPNGIRERISVEISKLVLLMKITK